METQELLWQIGQRVSKQRQRLKMTQEELAERMDVSVQMISYLESGKKAIRPENLVKLCQALQVSADYILSGHASSADADRIMQKLSRLNPRDFHLIEEIIDNCIALADKK